VPEESQLLRHVPAGAGRVLVCADDVAPLAAALRALGVAEIVAVADGPAADGEATAVDQLLRGTLATVGDALAGPFDVILCEENLARVRDHAACLLALLPLLRPGGKLLAQVPNLQYYAHVIGLLEGRWEYQPGTALDRRNLRFFTAFSLSQAVKTAGFHCEQVMVTHLAPPEDVPRDAEGYLVFDRFRLGPFDDHGYNGYRARTLLVVATRPEPGA
jgi:hypothetical protein